MGKCTSRHLFSYGGLDPSFRLEPSCDCMITNSVDSCDLLGELETKLTCPDNKNWTLVFSVLISVETEGSLCLLLTSWQDSGSPDGIDVFGCN